MTSGLTWEDWEIHRDNIAREKGEFVHMLAKLMDDYETYIGALDERIIGDILALHEAHDDDVACAVARVKDECE